MHYNHGIRKYSGIFDLAVEHGFLKSPAQGWYWKDAEQTQKVRRKALERDEEFMNSLVNNADFKNAIEAHYSMTNAGEEEKLDEEEETVKSESRNYTLK